MGAKLRTLIRVFTLLVIVYTLYNQIHRHDGTTGKIMPAVKWESREDMNGVKWEEFGSYGAVGKWPTKTKYEAFSWLESHLMPLGEFDTLSEAKNAVEEHVRNSKSE